MNSLSSLRSHTMAAMGSSLARNTWMSFSSSRVRARASFWAVFICEALTSDWVTRCLSVLDSRRGRSCTSTNAMVNSSPL